MSRRTIIIESLIESISATTSVAGYRGMKFLHEINSFPVFYAHPTGDTRIHIGSGTTYGVLSIAIRAYIWSDNLDDVDSFGRTLEDSIEFFYQSNRDLVEETRVTSFRTDEGIMAPYGAVDILVTIVYDALDGINQPVKTIYYNMQNEAGTDILTPSGLAIRIPSEFK